MSAPVIHANVGDTLKNVVTLMARYRISMVLVYEGTPGAADFQCYTLTHGDIVRYLSANDFNIVKLPAAALVDFSRPAVSVPLDASIQDAITAMVVHGIKRVLVVDVAGRPAGVVTATDILRWNDARFQGAVPYVLVVTERDSGIPYLVHFFPAAPPDLLPDLDLFGGAMRAITALTSELVRESGHLRLIEKDHYTILLEPGALAMGILIASRATIYCRKRLKNFMAQFEREYQPLLEQATSPRPPPVTKFRPAMKLVEYYFLEKDE